jgi:cell division protein FtsB
MSGRAPSRARGDRRATAKSPDAARTGRRVSLRAGVGRRLPARRTRGPRLPGRISGRAAALGVLLLTLTLAYAYPVRVFLAQQAQIDQLRAAQDAQRQRIESLKQQIARWNDPNYVIMQARTRLGLVRKGELLFVVQPDPSATNGNATPANSSWSMQMWSSIQGADNPDG